MLLTSGETGKRIKIHNTRSAIERIRNELVTLEEKISGHLQANGSHSEKFIGAKKKIEKASSSLLAAMGELE